MYLGFASDFVFVFGIQILLAILFKALQLHFILSYYSPCITYFGDLLEAFHSSVLQDFFYRQVLLIQTNVT